MRTLKTSLSSVAWVATALFLAAMQDAAAQGAAAAAPPHHVKRYIALGVLVLVIIGVFAWRASKKKPA